MTSADALIANGMVRFARYRALQCAPIFAHGSSRAEVPVGAIRMDGRLPGHTNSRYPPLYASAAGRELFVSRGHRRPDVYQSASKATPQRWVPFGSTPRRGCATRTHPYRGAS